MSMIIHRETMKAPAACVAIFIAGCLTASAQYTNRSSVLDGSGTVSSGGGYTNISASCQPGGISLALAGTLPVNPGTIVNQPGFVNAFVLRPNQLSIHGLPVEIDPDNDGDALSDLAELTGSSFSPAAPTDPNKADSDADGIADGAEALAGTNPGDDSSVLMITSIAVTNGQCVVAWNARGNNERTYRVLTATEPGKPFSTVIFSNSVAGGVAPWYVVTKSVVAAATTNSLFYRVDVAH
ncbi:MAG: hypothetical protein C0404_03745 [Verrucomicrobia bacterium]|nr:hypothetical protein [Verrucomicrobiota bacterium]